MVYAVEAEKLVKVYVTGGGLLRRRRRRVEALRGVSFRVERGTVFGLLGPNGAGKTTTVKIISTILLPDGGTARVMGYDVVSEADAVREVIGLSLSVERGFWYLMSGLENLVYFALLRGMGLSEAKRRARELLELVGLEAAADKPVEQYSLGMKARLALARALLHDPDVVILDEPTLGLDPPTARRIRSLLRSLATEHGKTVFLTTHNMVEAETLCDHIAIINRGVIVAEGTPQQLKRMVADRLPLVVRAWGDQKAAEEAAASLGQPYRVEADREGFLRVRVLAPRGEEEKLLAELVARLVGRGVKVVEARVEEPSLEDVFIRVTGGSTRVQG